MASVTLNGFSYSVALGKDGKPDIVQGYVARVSPAIRTTGVTQRSDDPSGIVRYQHRGFPLGFGANRIQRETGKGLGQFRDATVMTDYASGVYLPLLAQDSTDTAGAGGSAGVYRASVSFKRNIWVVVETTNAGQYAIKAAKYTGATSAWTTDGGLGGVISAYSATQSVGLDIIAHKTRMIALFATSNDHVAYFSTDGVTWTAATTAISLNLLSDAVTANEDIDAGLLAQVGLEAIAIVWDEVSGTITFFSSANAGANWADEAVDIPSGNGPQGVAVYNGTDGLVKLLVGTREGLWEVNVAPATWTVNKILDLPAHSQNFRRMTVHQGSLWFGIGVDDSSPAPIWTMTVSGDLRVFDTKRGLDQVDGLPVEMMGPVRWMKSAGTRLFASIGGGAALRNGRVIVNNGNGWHSRYRHGTAALKIEWIDVSADDDATQRLHFSVRTSAPVSDTQFQALPLTDPAAGATMAYATSGYLRIPDDDLGDPQTNATLYRVIADVDDLNATTAGEYIAVEYGLDGAVDNTTSLGNLLSGAKTLAFGASSQGVAGLHVALRLTFNRDAGSTADSPKLREFEIQAEKRVLAPRYWDFVLDVERTALESPPTPVAGTPIQETIINNLETVVELNTMPLFSVGQVTAIRVKVPSTMPPRWPLEIKGASRGNLGYRSGFIPMR